MRDARGMLRIKGYTAWGAKKKKKMRWEKKKEEDQGDKQCLMTAWSFYHRSGLIRTVRTDEVLWTHCNLHSCLMFMLQVRAHTQTHAHNSWFRNTHAIFFSDMFQLCTITGVYVSGFGWRRGAGGPARGVEVFSKLTLDITLLILLLALAPKVP